MLVAIAVVGILVLSRHTTSAAGASVSLACGPAQAVAFDDSSFTPYAAQRTHALLPPLSQTGRVVISIDDPKVPVQTVGIGQTLLGKPLTLLVALEDPPGTGGTLTREIRAYYGPANAADLTVDAFLSAGGVIIGEASTTGRDATFVIGSVGKRAATVGVGPYVAALVHADPLADGTRPYGLYWSDGTLDLSIVAGDLAPESVIGIARAFYCG